MVFSQKVKEKGDLAWGEGRCYRRTKENLSYPENVVTTMCTFLYFNVDSRRLF